ncbi:ABC transporter permease [Cohnella sp. CIP 111063]|mgnify:CR=1 FL=1|jgi:ABC-type sugar transport system permease subunit|uniref:carbohydrate ABC transporter permease n=1 Tax=unclassified Cohnella TaxID=2636738 RepID=UPI000B8C08DF|nr:MULTISPECIES: sugar ABC transporter permease [unclassified Cohnella]OXS58083.1 ABC transporter permease [Cohnella sp. CIP 111063]PRX71427.1 ABC-type sugar transport system permease subunit [Cohnella sp. SGD-V74]
MSGKTSRRRQLLQFRWKEYGMGYLFMLPWMIGFVAFVAFPIGWSLWNSFNQVFITSEGFKYTWVGLSNFRRMLVENNAYPIILITYLQEVLLIIPLILIFSFFVSLLLNEKFPGRGWMRALFFLPVIFATGQVIMELFVQGAGELPFMEQYNLDVILRQYFNESTANMLLGILGKAVIILWYSGVQILIFIAGFQTIPKTVYEAVRVDGASPWESFWKITFPGMLPFIGLNAVYTIVDLFTFPFNPVLEIVRNNMFSPTTGYGYASAMAWLYFAIVLVLLGITLWLTYRATKGRGELR